MMLAVVWVRAQIRDGCLARTRRLEAAVLRARAQIRDCCPAHAQIGGRCPARVRAQIRDCCPARAQIRVCCPARADHRLARRLRCLDRRSLVIACFNNYTDGYHRDDRDWSLSFDALKAINRAFIRLWPEWLEDAPAEWLADGFLQQHVPTVISRRVGQNQAICTGLPDERAQWLADRHWDKVGYVSVALASHLS
jgi:hypothetical protein